MLVCGVHLEAEGTVEHRECDITAGSAAFTLLYNTWLDLGI